MQSLADTIEMGLEGVVYWRGQKAAEHSGDDRNNDAVAIATRLLAGDRTIDTADAVRFEMLGAALEAHPESGSIAERFTEAESKIFRDIGFRSTPDSFNGLAADLCDAWEAIIHNTEARAAA